ncbi:MAG: hypothetical protein M3198_14000, partial [Actinomycetota bacterium]|nr:hypothetical protein [Actinomycetota bacterium]
LYRDAVSRRGQVAGAEDHGKSSASDFWSEGKTAPEHDPLGPGRRPSTPTTDATFVPMFDEAEIPDVPDAQAGYGGGEVVAFAELSHLLTGNPQFSSDFRDPSESEIPSGRN